MPRKTKIAYVCKQMWDSDDWLSLDLYPSPEALPSDHRDCGVVRVRVSLSQVVRECTRGEDT